MTDIERRLIVNDSRVCWLYSDGSHRALTQDDCDIINTRAAPVDVQKLAEETAEAVRLRFPHDHTFIIEQAIRKGRGEVA